MLKPVPKPNSDQEKLLDLLAHPGWPVFIAHMEARRYALGNDILRFKKDNSEDDYLKGQRDYADYIVRYKDLIESAELDESNLWISLQTMQHSHIATELSYHLKVDCNLVAIVDRLDRICAPSTIASYV